MAFSSIFGGSSSNNGDVLPLSTSTSSVSTNAIKDKVKQELELELAAANATELVNKLTETCFEKCPSGEDACVSQCVQKYMTSWNIISNTYVQLIQKAGK